MLKPLQEEAVDRRREDLALARLNLDEFAKCCTLKLNFGNHRLIYPLFHSLNFLSLYQ